jgi:GTP-binding protein YchF
MGFTCGIVGLPNVGKSTLFNAVSGAHAASSNYPFCTIEPNKAWVVVPDENLARLAPLVESQRVTPTSIELVDVAGLVEGAHRGEGLGNTFLAHIRQLDAVMHLVRVFRDPDVAREEPLDPVKDLRVIMDELRFRDVESIDERLSKERKRARAAKDDSQVVILERLKERLTTEELVRPDALDEEERALAAELFLLLAKPYFVVANVDEEDIGSLDANESLQALTSYLAPAGVPVLAISARIEEEIYGLEPEEQATFLAEYGLDATGLQQIIRTGYELLDLITFYTFNENELRAWTLKRGSDVVAAAGKVHSDMAAGFIRADVVHLDDFLDRGSFRKAREEGKLITAGRDYIVGDRDIVLVKFKV